MEGFDKKKLNITVHHLEGSIRTDNRTKPAPVESQLYAHCACHKAYHQIERLILKGRNVDTSRFAAMEANVLREVNRIKFSKKFYK
jgi:UDP-N-acetylglucosamine 2-epimerase